MSEMIEQNIDRDKELLETKELAESYRQSIVALVAAFRDRHGQHLTVREILRGLKSGVEPDEEAEPPTLTLADLPPGELTWLWHERIPLGRLTCLLAPRGTGKSVVALDLAARVTRGAPWPDAPDEQDGTAGSVLIVAGEDDLIETIVPRLRTAGADLRKVHTLTAPKKTSNEREPFALTNLRPLERALDAHPDLRLVVIDPVTAFLGWCNVRGCNELDKRLRELAALAARRRIAILLVNATDKVSNGMISRSANDIIPFLNNVSRTAWTIVEDPEDPARRLFLPARVNLGGDPGGLRFGIDRASGKMSWQPEPVALRGDVMKPSARASSEVAKAAAWLRSFLADGPRPADELLREGLVAGYSRRALYAAKDRLGVGSTKSTHSFVGRWFWVRPGAVEDPQHAKIPNHAHRDADEGSGHAHIPGPAQPHSVEDPEHSKIPSGEIQEPAEDSDVQDEPFFPDCSCNRPGGVLLESGR